MRLSSLQLLLLCLVGEFLGLDTFLKGFFPVKKGVGGHASFSNIPEEPFGSLSSGGGHSSANPPIDPVFGRLVIILIDALRADFVYGERNKADMPYTRALFNNGGTRNFLARAHPPTVTMPRIKALTSGTIPGFVDIILNFDSAALAEDNIVSQMHKQGRHLRFYGDDTWLRLFPGHFSEADGTTSFFVTDYTEVDNNVTRHVRPSLADPNWDVLILHYLGLDHIGHLGGPRSPLVPPKLREMDDVIRTIHEAIVQQDKSSALPSLIVVCGDHGMSDAGSHGGASASETITPIVFISSAFKNTQGVSVPHPDEIQQIDLAPTLSLLMALPIPQNSLGVAIPAMLEEGLSARQHLRALQLNGYQLSRVLERNVDSFESDEGYSAYQYAVRLHGAWLMHTANGSSSDAQSLARKASSQYLKAMDSMRDRVASSLAKYDLHSMGYGVILLWLVLLLLTYSASSLIGRINTTPDPNPSLLLLIGCCLVMGIIQVALCTSAGGGTSELLCAPSKESRIRSVALIATIGSVAAFLLSRMGFRSLYSSLRSLKLSWIETFLLLGTLGHTLTLAASSFVEEEHQTWYFLSTTLLLALFSSATISVIDQSGDKMAPTIAMATGVALAVSRLLRAWNQTGMKWADRADIGDWLVRPENRVSLSVLTAVSFAVVYIIRCYQGWPKYRLLLALVGAYLYRYATGSLVLPFSLPMSEKGLYEAWMVYGLVFTSLGSLVLHYAREWYSIRHQAEPERRTTSSRNSHNVQTQTSTSGLEMPLEEIYDVLLMMTALLLRPHNSCVTAMLVVLQHCIVGLTLPRLGLRLWAVALVHIWMGQASFFAQGNSNSIATVDISAGYVGMTSYVHSVAGLLTAISTYAGPSLWLMRLLIYTAEHYRDRYQSAVVEVAYALALTRALPLALYTALVSFQRYHLFVWSVFSPKLLYETMNTYVVTGGILIALVHSGMAKWLQSPRSR